MNYLLDSHSIIWSSLQPEKLSHATSIILENPQNQIHVSHISFWEICIKYSIGKINLHGGTPADLLNWCKKVGFKILPLSENEVVTFHQLPRALHKDPFDRMLVWQAIHQQYILVSNDKLLESYLTYGLKLHW